MRQKLMGKNEISLKIPQFMPIFTKKQHLTEGESKTVKPKSRFEYSSKNIANL
jgi:hypothetical protein